MSIPTILTYQETPRLSQNVFTDLCMDQWLSEDCRCILAHPCSAGEIERRQALFRLMESDEYKTSFSDFSQSLHALARALRLFYRQRNPSFILLQLLNVIQLFEISLSKLKQVGGCAITDEVISYWFDEQHMQAYARMKELEERLSRFVSEISSFDVSIGQQFYICKSTGSTTYLEELERAAEELDLSTRRTNRKSSPVDQDFIAVHSRLYAGETMRALIKEASDASRSEMDELASYVSHCDFVLEMEEQLSKARANQIPTCYPGIAAQRCYVGKQLYDITLLHLGHRDIVPNDVDFSTNSFYFLTGANSGGKTTYLRALAVNLILFTAGCPIYGSSAVIYPFRSIGTHFPRDEELAEVGRLEDEINRVQSMVDQSGSDAFLFFNETYSGTNDVYGCALAIQTARNMASRNQYGLFVTHFHGVEQSPFPILTAQVDIHHNNKRTFLIRQKGEPAASYAADILKKHELDFQSLSRRSIKCQ